MKIKKLKKKKSPSAKSLQRKIESILRKVIFKRDGNRCLRCGTDKNLQMSHIFPRGEFPGMMFMEDNIQTLCARHHLWWFHKNPVHAYQWLIEVVTPKTLDKLDRLTTLKLKKPNLQDLLNELLDLYGDV